MENNKPVFEVCRNNKRLFWTAYQKCVPSEEEIALLKKAHYKIKNKNSSNK